MRAQGGGTPAARALPWVCALLVAAPWAVPVAATHFPDDPSCGNLSPFANTCAGPGVLLSSDPTPSVAVLGFEGRILVRLEQNHGVPPFGFGRVVWACDALFTATADPCVLLEQSGLLIPLRPVSLFCHAVGHPVFLGLVPPAGPWGCTVDM